MKYAAVIWLVFTVVMGHQMMEMSFTRGYSEGRAQGYQRGYEQGNQDGQAVQTQEQVLQVCTQWWFGDGNPRAMQAINQYCDRR